LTLCGAGSNNWSIDQSFSPPVWAAVDAAIAAEADAAVDFLTRLVRVPSTVRQEAAAREIVAAELIRHGFEVEHLAIPETTAAAAPAGVAQASYSGRQNVAGWINRGESPSLLLNGHVDVVPADGRLWSADPYAPVIAGGWLTGRGAGDMKGGLAMGLLAVAGLRRAVPEAISGELVFASVIEEECTGNGTLAAARAGVLGDAVVLLEPTDLRILRGGIGILWIEIILTGVAAHAESADRAVNPVSSIPVILTALAEFESEMRTSYPDPEFDAVVSGAAVSGTAGSPYNVNVGAVRAGDWPSSIPGRAVLGVRLGFPRAWTPGQAFERVSAAISGAAAADPMLSLYPPVIRETGFRAEGFVLAPGHPLAAALADAHADANGQPPHEFVLGATMDARYYLNQYGRPALAYGPVARNIHGADEAVELASIAAGARTLARFIAGYYAGGGLPDRARLAGELAHG
jgi:acetylornithine deacetylase